MFFPQVERHKSKMAKAKEQAESRLLELADELAAVKLSEEKLRAECKIRGISGADSEEIRRKCNSLTKQVLHLKEEISVVERTSWAKEMDVSKLIQCKDQRVRDFNSALMKLDPDEAQKDSLTLNEGGFDSDEVFNRLLTLKAEKRSSLREAEQKKTRLTAEKAKVEAENKAKSDGMGKLQADFESSSRAVEAKHNRIKAEEVTLEEAVNALKAELTELKERKSEDLNALKRSVVTSEREVTESRLMTEEMEAETCRYVKEQNDKAKAFLTSKEAEVKTALKEFRDKADEEIRKDLDLIEKAKNWQNDVCAKLDKLDENK